MPAPTPVRSWPQITLFRTLLRAHESVVRQAKKQVAEQCGLSMMQFDMIAELGGQDPMRMGELSKRMITSPSSATRVCQQLEKLGLVSRRRSAHSDREVVASLTPDGDAFFAEHFLHVAERIAQIFDKRLGSEEQQMLAIALGKLT